MKRLLVLLAAIALLVACEPQRRERTPEQVQAELLRLLPAKLADRRGWAADVQTAFAALKLEPSTSNLCAALAVTEQESTFNADPQVPGLAKIARAEIERRAGGVGVPKFLVGVVLGFDSPDGRTYEERLAKVRTERQLSEIYEAFIGSVPLGRRILAGANPVHTGGPMQVSVDFAQEFSKSHDYPWGEPASIRHEVFTRRGGMYFGIAHLLAWPASYDRPLYRFADFNAGFHASRNAAFQHAVSRVSGIDIALDGDLLLYGKRKAGATESALRAMAWQLEMDDRQIRRDLEKSTGAKFEDTRLYQRTFALADGLEHAPLPRARVPSIRLDSPKITRKLTTQWFAERVEQRYQRCLARAR
ncbi:MAG: DUF1615 domain-containing protein [Arenimonas sp.]